MIYVYPVTPVPAPRQVRKDAWNPSPAVQRYRGYRDELRLLRAHVPEPFHHAVFIMPMPESWSARKRAQHEGQPHLCKPDRDNLEKALLDSVFGEDSHVWDGRTTKLWGRRGMVIVSAQPINVTLPFDLSAYYHAIERDNAGLRAYAFAPPCPV